MLLSTLVDELERDGRLRVATHSHDELADKVIEFSDDFFYWLGTVERRELSFLFNRRKLVRAFRETRVARNIITLKRWGSGLDFAERVAVGKLFGGTVINVLDEFACRGRMGARWRTAPFQLRRTIILSGRTFLRDPRKAIIAVTAGVARFCKLFNVDLVWPNDFYFGERKVGGILFKIGWEGEYAGRLILGVGFNVLGDVGTVDGLRTASLIDALGKSIKREMSGDVLTDRLSYLLYAAIATKLMEMVFRKSSRADLTKEILSISNMIGRRISVKMTYAGKVSGTLVGVDDNFSALIETSNRIAKVDYF
jgi:biotin-(acetyl-CoA carboxylase) ligase